MTLTATLRAIQRRVQWRDVLIELARWLPWIVVASYLAQRLTTPLAGIAAGVLGLAGLAVRLRHVWRRIDRGWLIRALDQSDRDLHDSSDLLFADTATLSPLQGLQQARVSQQLARSGVVDLRGSLPWRPLLAGLLAAGLWVALLWLWQPLPPMTSTLPNAPIAAAAEAALQQSLSSSLVVTPPAYTALPARQTDQLDVQVAQDSELSWSLRFAIEPTSVRLRLLDGETLSLQAFAGQWRGSRRFSTSTVYRIEFDGAPALPVSAAHAIEVQPDRAPQLLITEPQATLTVLEAAARNWPFKVIASDDYGLGVAELHLTLAQGEGEQVTVSERRIRLRGSGDARRLQYTQMLDLLALGFAQGDDLIARVEVRDRRQPTPNLTRSASFILRWPAERSSEGTGVEGLLQKTLPAYFRSQRQIIIDTETLIAEKPRLSADTALERADTIGVDQRILRLRYGQFLGEEAEEIGAEEEHEDGGHHDEEEPEFGNAAELIAAVGHGHDIAEAATLLDPATRELLRAALGEMWQAELQLRTGDPNAALPFENRALEYIKRFQQAGRIYLARVGLELPALDATRRLSGERPKRARTADPLAEDAAASPPERMWLALQTDAELPLAELLAWLQTQSESGDAGLPLLADIDALQQAPACVECRLRLANALWPLLTPPANAPALRPRLDPLGRAYLNALAPAENTP